MAHSLPPPPSLPLPTHFTRRSLLLLSTTTTTTTLSRPSLAAAPPSPNTTITDRVFMDFSLCPNSFVPNPNRTLGDTFSPLCSDSTLLGRVVLGLYGNLVPLTVSNFKSLCLGLGPISYKNTLVHKIFPGQYFLAGRQGRPDKAENDDDDDIKLDPGYRNVEFLITTGPGPCPQLDYRNIVFGTVLEGLDVITAIASIPTYQPSERIRQFNNLAKFFGDERAQNARNIWNRPLTTVYISDCGELQVTKPSLTPSLP
ncbi:peptidyl-prolyl cis-trans isomerase CYP28, chloroplastic isoform X2 [Abrus precatorius]|uniref:Peptidyl-prolyl cis-trans isomerase n=1 Tax=Abrus precatorius TaxID=3816 RepID=A0A8B8K6I0_ABRPR|nr:peptidyl-prolyl cis-trans isomerase CYP28, chloroplastic isoform X2 [Abrus precatorius]